MSADNYIYVREHDGLWLVSMEFASCELAPPGTRGTYFDTKAGALAYASDWCDAEYIEYGVRCDEDLQAMHDEKRAGQEEIMKALSDCWPPAGEAKGET